MQRKAADTRMNADFRHRVLTALLASCLVGSLAVVAPPAQGAGVGKALIGRLLRRDLARDAATAARPLVQPRTVYRYTTRRQAAQEARVGLAPNTHMTANAPRGRPLSAESAQRRFGLPTRPEMRAKIRLPAGQPARHNKALGGEPGRGELTSPKPVPKSSIIGMVPLK